MPFWRLNYHLVWSTKNREPFIQPNIEQRLYGYLTNKAAELGVYVYAINGCNDHLHMVVAVPPKHALAYVLKTLKGSSAHDLNQVVKLDYHFAWQRGYGALTLGEKQKPIAIAYVKNQKQHHQQQDTNPWLERAAEFDEGPDDTGLIVGPVPEVVREGREPYHYLGNPPF